VNASVSGARIAGARIAVITIRRTRAAPVDRRAGARAGGTRIVPRAWIPVIARPGLVGVLTDVVDAAIIGADVVVVTLEISVAWRAVGKRSPNAAVIHARRLHTRLIIAFFGCLAAIRDGHSPALPVRANIVGRAGIAVIARGRVRRVRANAGMAPIVGAFVPVITLAAGAATCRLPCADADPAGASVVDRAWVAVVAGNGRTGTAAAYAAVA